MDGERSYRSTGPATPSAPSSKLETRTGLAYQVRPISSGQMNRVGEPSTSCSALNNAALASKFLRREHHTDSSEPTSHPQFSVQQARSVMFELFATLRSAFNDERVTPEERLRRASAILQAAQEPRQPAVGKKLSARLARGAVVGFVVRVRDALHGGPALLNLACQVTHRRKLV